MLHRLLHVLKTSPFYTVFSRFVVLYGTMNRRGRQSMIAMVINQGLSTLMGTFAFIGAAGFVIVLSKPQIILDNRYIAMAYDGLGFESQSHFLVLLSGLLVLLIIVQQVLTQLSALMGVRLTQALSRRCSVMLYRYYLADSYERHMERKTSAAIGKIMKEVRQVVISETGRVCGLVVSLVNGFFIFAVLYAVQAGAALILLLVTVGFYIYFFSAYKNKIRFFGKQEYQKHVEQIGHVREGMMAATEIRMMGKEKEFINRASHLLQEIAQNEIRKALVNAIPQPAIRIAAVIALYFSATYVFLTDSPESAFASLALFAVCTFRVLPSLHRIFSILMAQEETLYRYQRVVPDLQAASRVAGYQDTGASNLVQVKDGIVFENVTYAYPGTDKPVIDNLSLSFPANRAIALFGRSGVGKTTVIRLVSGLLFPRKGRVLIDGKSLHDDEAFKRDWRRSSGVAFQNPFFMDATVAMNIAFELERKKIDYDRVWKLVRLVQLEDLVANLPNGLDTEIREDARTLSGGQRQRIALARALYRDSSILILDEATNALDLVVEKRIIELLAGEKSGKVIIIIAHRPETIRFADLVTFMKQDGSVVQGGYDELVGRDADFRDLVGARELLAG